MTHIVNHQSNRLRSLGLELLWLLLMKKDIINEWRLNPTRVFIVFHYKKFSKQELQFGMESSFFSFFYSPSCSFFISKTFSSRHLQLTFSWMRGIQIKDAGNFEGEFRYHIYTICHHFIAQKTIKTRELRKRTLFETRYALFRFISFTDVHLMSVS